VVAKNIPKVPNPIFQGQNLSQSSLHGQVPLYFLVVSIVTANNNLK
jgi:hypothetical protein